MEALSVLNKYFKALSEPLEPDIVSAKITAYLARQGFSGVNRDAITETLLNFWKRPEWRDFVWMLHMKLPLSWLLRVADKAPRTWSSLRSAIIFKLLMCDEDEIIREFIRIPGKFRRIFRRFRLPIDKFNNKEIRNKKWKFIVSLVRGKYEILEKIKAGDVETLIRWKVPAYMALQYLSGKKEKIVEYFEKLAKYWPEEFMRHFDACVRYLGMDKANQLKSIALKRTKPTQIVTKKELEEHLIEKKILSEEEIEKLREKQIREIEKIFREFNVHPMIIVDLSGSMNVAIDVINLLKDTIFRNIPADYIAFKDVAFDITEEVKAGVPLSAGGSTSITAGFWYAAKKAKERYSDMRILAILVSDLGHNTPCNDPDIPSNLGDSPQELLRKLIEDDVFHAALIIACGSIDNRELRRYTRIPRTFIVKLESIKRPDVLFKGVLDLVSMLFDVNKAREILDEKILRRPESTKKPNIIERILLSDTFDVLSLLQL